GFEPHPDLAEGVVSPSITLMRFLESPWVQWTWGIVAAALFVRTVASWLWSAWLRWKARPLDSWEAWWLLQSCKQASHLETPVSVWESAAVKSPCLLGLVRPKLLLPKGLFRELKLAELRLVFLHELAHLRRRDLAFNWIMAAVELIHWFNPMVWFVTRRLRADREEDCDALALATEPTAQSEYGEVILKLIERGVTPAESALAPAMGPGGVRMLGNNGESDLRPLLHRMRAIKRFRPEARTWLVGFCTWLAVALIGFTDAEPSPIVEVARAGSANAYSTLV
ncbi:MAG TPA: M56 family metallopeptidase, partial [Verrucomicrobiota bacterium]|nr:M56 family metallopeptidase [Verrucomicrobiota bacterium]